MYFVNKLHGGTIDFDEQRSSRVGVTNLSVRSQIARIWGFIELLDYGSDHKLLVAKFRLKMKKVGKTIKPFMYDINQIPYDYTLEVKNRFKELDLVDRVPEELWVEVHNIVQEAMDKTIPKKKKCKKEK